MTSKLVTLASEVKSQVRSSHLWSDRVGNGSYEKNSYLVMIEGEQIAALYLTKIIVIKKLQITQPCERLLAKCMDTQYID